MIEQIFICVHGRCKILLDYGKEKVTVSLDKPYEGLYLSSNIWREMYDFSSDAVLMVLASELYDESDYIRNYDKFLEYIKIKEVKTLRFLLQISDRCTMKYRDKLDGAYWRVMDSGWFIKGEECCCFAKVIRNI